jgi:hypothetical protein
LAGILENQTPEGIVIPEVYVRIVGLIIELSSVQSSVGVQLVLDNTPFSKLNK